MQLNKYDISNLFILSFVFIFTIFVFLYEISDTSLDNEYEKFSTIQKDTSNPKYSSENYKNTNEEIINENYEKISQIIDNVNEEKPINILKEIKIDEIKFSYYSPYGKYTPEITDKIIDINREIFYIYIIIKDLSLEDSYHKFELYTNFFNPNGDIIESISRKIGIFEGSNYIYTNQRVISIPIAIENKEEGLYNFNVAVKDLISNEFDTYEGNFNIISE